MLASIKRYFMGILLLVFFVAVGYGVVHFYPWLFSRSVKGTILKIERVDLNVSLMQGADSANPVNPSLFSFAVSIKEPNGEIITASAEDRQWAAAQSGLCAEALFFRYPPWNVMKGGTFFNARLDRLYECPPAEATPAGP